VRHVPAAGWQTVGGWRVEACVDRSAARISVIRRAGLAWGDRLGDSPVFLDKEFATIARQAAVGPRTADLIVQLRLRAGGTSLIVLHVEVQGQSQTDFAARMFTYYALIHLRLWRQRRRRGGRSQGEMPLILGMAVLTDESLAWQPGAYEARGFGLGIRYDYRALKLRDPQVRADLAGLTGNPFALVARTWLEVQAAGRREDDMALAVRAALLALREGRYNDDHLAAILAFIEQATTLPVARYRTLVDEVIQTEGTAMAQVMSYIERKGWRRGREEGRAEGRLTGREEGREEGRVVGLEEGRVVGLEEGRLDVLLHVLGRIVGPINEVTTSRIQALGADALLELADAAFAFNDRADLDRWLSERGV
jgi:hypothetical protein